MQGIKLQILKTEKEYEEELKRIDEIFNAEEGSPESNKADLLNLLIDDYEKRNYSIDTPDPIEAIKLRMEELSLKQNDLVGIIGTKSRVSEVLNKKRKLTVEMIRNVALKLNIPVNILISDY